MLGGSNRTSRLSAEHDRVIIVANPKAGASSRQTRIARLMDQLRQRHLTPVLVHDLSEFAGRLDDAQSAGRLRAVVAAGGDGTVAEVINRTPPGAPVTMLAMGTENLLSKYLDMPHAPDEVAEVIAAGRIITQDAGCASGRLFALMISCGLDAEIVRRMHATRRGHITHWNYLKPIVDVIRSYGYPELRIYCDPDSAVDGKVAEPVRARHAFVFNLPRYALGFQFAPDAVGDDGLLDICTFRHGSLGHDLWYLSNVILQRHRHIADCTMLRAKRVRIEADVPVAYNLDGDHGGYLPADIEIVPDRLTLLAPPGWIDRETIRSAARRA